MKRRVGRFIIDDGAVLADGDEDFIYVATGKSRDT